MCYGATIPDLEQKASVLLPSIIGDKSKEPVIMANKKRTLPIKPIQSSNHPQMSCI